MKERYHSLDVFRGATVALMIMVNNPGSWEHIFDPLDHAKWHGCTPTDLVFPFFLFAVGNAMAFVMPAFEQAGSKVFLKKVIRRTLLIFLIGFFLNWSPFIMWHNDSLVLKPWEWKTDDGALHGIRVPGVLQRIALCYFFASLIIFYLKRKGAIITGIILLLVYWLLCYTLGASGDPYSLQGFFGTNIDISVFGEPHVYHGESVPFDPEGIASTTAAIVEVIGGYLVGQYIRQNRKNFEMLSNLFVAGALLCVLGYLWNMSFPINKKIWTSSYVVYTTGLATLTLSTLIFFIEFKNYRGAVSRFFDVFGKNPLFIFVISGFLPRVLGIIRINNGIGDNGKQLYVSPFGWFYEHVCKNIGADLRIGSLLYALCMIAFYWLIVYILDRKRIYIRV